MKMILGTLVVLCLLAAATPLMLSESNENHGSQGEQKPGTKVESTKKKSSEVQIHRVDLCEMKRDMEIGKEDAAKKNRGWMEMEIQDHTKKTRARGMVAHSDVTLSVKKRDKVLFFCKEKYPVRIDTFERASAPGCGPSPIPPGPDSPFAPSQTFPTARQPQVVLGPAVAQGCYKFSFTVWMTADPAGSHVDPHLIVDP